MYQKVHVHDFKTELKVGFLFLQYFHLQPLKHIKHLTFKHRM